MPKLNKLSTSLILRHLLAVLDPILRPIERSRIERYAPTHEAIAPIFILGVPRSGTTLFYQLLTDHYRVEYIDNLAHTFYRTLFTGVQLSHYFFNEQPHQSFSSSAGKTEAAGWHAPNEAPRFWYRFMSRDKPRVGPDQLPQGEQRILRDTLTAIMEKYGRPLIMKNLFNNERVPLLKALFPRARFFHVERDKVATALSIYRERKKLGIPDEAWWSARPANYRSLMKLPLVERIAAQVHHLDEQIRRDLGTLAPERVESIRYEDLCSDPLSLLHQLEKGILQDLKIRHHASSYPIRNPAKDEDDGELRGLFEKAFAQIEAQDHG